MNLEELRDFTDLIIDLATYNTKIIDEKEFFESIRKLKQTYIAANMEIPLEIKTTIKSYDYRRELQKFGGYNERRERIKETFYPLINYLENKIDNTKQTGIFSQKKLNDYLKLNNYTIKTIYGNIKNISITETNAGGNGIVYFGTLNNHEVAIKFLLKNDKNKKNRFLCEFFNVLIGFDDNEGIVKQYFYEEIVIDDCSVPIIVMKKYSNHLEYVDNIEQEDLISIFHQLAQALKKIHNNGIIHRDLKPKNILIDEKNRLNIADFGISYFNSNIYDMTGHTQKSERLANYEFSAPEQKNSEKELTKAADIYSFGQILYWLVFNETCKGTRRRKITEKYKGEKMELLDDIIDKCIANDPGDRYQSIDEIYKYVDSKKKITDDLNVNVKVVKNESEIKRQLKDIIYHITFTIDVDQFGDEFETFAFRTFNKFTKEMIVNFLNRIKSKNDELLFFDKVKLSDYFEEVDNMFYQEYLIEKKYFLDLHSLYSEVKDDEKLYLSFIKYILNSFNGNYIDDPFL